MNFWHIKYAKGWTSQSLICYDQDFTGCPIWKAANANRNLVKEHSFWEIGNGKEADFFIDAWKQLPNLRGEGKPSILQERLERGGLRKVKDF